MSQTSPNPEEVTRMRALLLVLEEGIELGAVARHLELKPSAILAWKRKYLSRLASGEITTDYFDPYREQIAELEAQAAEEKEAEEEAEPSNFGDSVDLRPRQSAADRRSPDGFLFEPVQNLSQDEREKRLARSRKKAVVQEAVRQVVNEGKTARDVAKDIGIAPASIQEWERKHADFVAKSPDDSKKRTDGKKKRRRASSKQRTPADAVAPPLEMVPTEETAPADIPAVPNESEPYPKTAPSEEEHSEFDKNWDEIVEEDPELFRECRVITPFRRALMENRLTKWMFKNEDGDYALGLLFGLAIIVIGGLFAIGLTISETKNVDAPLARGGLGANTAASPANLDLVIQAEVAAEDFLRAEGIEEKLRYVREPDQLEPIMRKWYADNDASAWKGDLSFKGGVAAGFKEGSFVILKIFREPEHKLVPVVAEHTDDGFKVDWETSVRYQPMDLATFQKIRPTEPLSFRFNISASDYFNHEFNDPEEWHCFKLTYPGELVDLSGYVRKGNDLGDELMTMIEFKSKVPLIIDIRFPENASAGNQVEILNIIQENWVLNYDSEAAKAFKR